MAPMAETLTDRSPTPVVAGVQADPVQPWPSGTVHAQEAVATAQRLNDDAQALRLRIGRLFGTHPGPRSDAAEAEGQADKIAALLVPARSPEQGFNP